MGAFSMLKDNSDCCVKIVKFKQGKLHELARDGKLIDESLFAISYIGACAAYCMAWLGDKCDPLVLLFDPHFHRWDGRKTSADKLSFRTVASSLPLQEQYVEDYKYAEKSNHHNPTNEAFKGLARQYRLKLLKFKESSDSQTLSDFVGNRFKELAAAQGAVIGFNVADPKTGKVYELGGHSCAIYRDAVNQYFFDPNVGEYIIKDFDKFFKLYLGILKYTFKWIPKYISAVFVEKL